MSSSQRDAETRDRHCRHLRTKSMYIPELSGQPGRLQPQGTENFWCQCTMRERGPDDRQVRMDACVHGRECFEEM